MMKKDNNELERHHINPAFILKRFKNEDGQIVRFLKNDFLFNNLIEIRHNHYCSENSNMFIVKKLNFFSEETFFKINEILKNETLETIKMTSLESSYNKYEDLMGKFLDKFLSGEEEISEFNLSVINSYIEISEMRSLKYFTNMNLCPIIELDPNKIMLNFNKIVVFFSNSIHTFDKTELSLNEKAIYLNIIIHFFIHNNFKFSKNHNFIYKEILSTDFVRLFNLINNQINNDFISKVKEEKIYLLETKKSSFINSDNPVLSIYRNESSKFFDMLSSNIFEDNTKINKLTFLVISPNNLIIKTDKEVILKDKILNENIIRHINTLILYYSDKWIVSNQTIIGKKDEIILFDFELYNLIEESFFYNKETCDLLNAINYHIGNFNKNIIFHFNITNPLKKIIENMISSEFTKVNNSTDIAEINSKPNFIARTFKNNDTFEIFWLIDEETMKFIQSLNYEYTYKILYKIRELLSEHLKYSPLKDSLEFIKLDGEKKIREYHSIEDYATGDKKKLLNCIRYAFVKLTYF